MAMPYGPLEGWIFGGDLVGPEVDHIHIQAIFVGDVQGVGAWIQGEPEVVLHGDGDPVDHLAGLPVDHRHRAVGAMSGRKVLEFDIKLTRRSRKDLRPAREDVSRAGPQGPSGFLESPGGTRSAGRIA